MLNGTKRAAYMAAAIDGEGWIGLKRKSPDKDKWVKSPSFSFGLSIANTNRAWLETLQTWYGGVVNRAEHGSLRNRKDSYKLQFRAAEVLTVLSHVRPYLLMKGRQADLLSEFFPLAARRRMLNGTTKHPSLGADPSIVARQEAIYQELRTLNQRGLVMQRYATRESFAVRTCSFDGCERKHYGHGYCWMHYRKFILRGGPALYDTACKECGKAFIARRKDAAYCSKECTSTAYYRINGEQIKAKVAARKKRLAALKE